MSNFSLEALLGLYSIPTIGAARMRKLISVFKSPQAVLDASARSLLEVEGIDRKTIQKIKNGPDDAFISSQLQLMRDYDVRIMTYWDKSYPQRLKKIYDPPAFLFMRGSRECFKRPAIAIVGTRLPTYYGRMVTERLTRELVQRDFAIISGFARGIDTIAHKTALKANGVTIAVMGNGLDIVYPAENKSLYQIIPEKGALLSEYPMSTKPDAGNFPKRNRIISGMSIGVLLTEAGQKSGALITALYAADQNREVFATPGSILSGQSAGSNRLIREGAKLVQNTDDIIEELQGMLDNKIKGSSAKKEQFLSLKGNEKKIYDLLNSEAQHVDQLAYKASLSPSEALATLLTLELMGAIQQLAGKMFVRI